ncbi:MAG: 16S rRNA (guanine(527)-N(7))-methyltransferase RsmG [Pseudomonadota bacterium]
MADRDGYGPDDLKSAFNVSRETLDRLSLIIQELDAWRQKINLIGPSEFDQVWRRHVLDSWQLFAHIPEGAKTVDLGSGSGFPGLVLAAGFAHQESHMTMIESVGKKCAFLRAAIQSAKLQANVIHGRVESVNSVQAQCVTARAFAPLPKLLAYAEPWLTNGAYGVFPKGRRWQEELTAAQESWRFSYEAIPSMSGDGAILKISEVSRVDH